MNNAIVALTRGYENKFGYRDLLTRNRCLFDTINKERKYPLILFHEGNIAERHRSYIRDNSNGQEIIFMDMCDVWDAKHGYESMCRFNSWWLWEVCSNLNYDNILRVDEDCHIMEMPVDPFEQMGDNVYLRSCYWAESHSETNAALPGMIQELTGANPEDFYNGKFPYTNVSLSSVKFWLENPQADVLKKIALSDEQTKNRFGDLPLLGSLLNIYAKDRVGLMEGLKYYHHSHDVVVTAH